MGHADPEGQSCGTPCSHSEMWLPAVCPDKAGFLGVSSHLTPHPKQTLPDTCTVLFWLPDHQSNPAGNQLFLGLPFVRTLDTDNHDHDCAAGAAAAAADDDSISNNSWSLP